MSLENILVIMPARGGSKRIANKNIKQICGRPMIHWPLCEILKKINKANIIVSTDNKKIAEIVSELGIGIPFFRPKELSDDYTGTAEVAKHALEWFCKKHFMPLFVAVVYPTAVLLNIDDILSSINIMKDAEDCDLIMTAQIFNAPIQRALRVDENGFANMLEPQHYLTRSQDLIETYHDAGQFYIYKPNILIDNIPIVDSKIMLKVLDKNSAVDIDNISDFHTAESIMFSRNYHQRAFPHDSFIENE